MQKRTFQIWGIGGTTAALLITVAYFIWGATNPAPTIQAASKIIRPEYQIFPAPYSETLAYNIFKNDSTTAALLNGLDYEFVYAVPLGSAEAIRWQPEGCWDNTCAHVTLFNYTDGGTIEAVVNMETQELLDAWSDPQARPGASPHVTHPALAIAAQDKEVQAVLGNIYDAGLMMVPMNIWLLDDACATDWCVDLTYHDPAGTGKIFHVTVNLQEKKVARTFYTRGRENRPYKDTPAQRDAYSDDCHEDHGWSICWEMTAHDGVNFYDVSYEGQEIFSSAKIPQVEVWYPSWPGGYRDEIGYAASVPPYFGTELETNADSFTVSQLFTEFTSWPNCICCYRYRQTMQFYADGTFEARFISYGPGCDSLSIYQPFWRIDMDLDGPNNDEAFVWTGQEWTEAITEQEFDLLADLSPDGDKLATIDGDLHYRWRYIPNDPLGLDEAFMFLVTYNENEGEIPVLPGPADTFEPPRQWMDEDEPYSGENITVWYIALQKTKKGGPWWCMPEPSPDITPCEAVLRVEPASRLPTAEELAAQQAALEATPPPEPTPTIDIPTAIPTIPLPGTQPAETAQVAPQVEGNEPEQILLNFGCTACHVIGDLGEHNKVGPDLTHIGTVSAERIPGMNAETYIRQSILEPNVFIAPDCPNGPCLENIMPDYYGERLSAAQLETLVTYLLNQTDQPAPTAAPIGEQALIITPEATPLLPIQEVQLENINAWYIAALSIALIGVLFVAVAFIRNE